jgi:lipopolysaccharide/colanic/teichoic acid biosynthesis glycosyltransferase
MMLKFRTMKESAEEAGAQMATRDDPRKTPLGAFLRRFSFDELPQFWNVLVGDMSLVGPRPERPVFIEEFKKQIPRYHLRHMVKSGITGWAQVNGLRGQTSIQKRIEFDLYYIENWSLLLDLKILARTALGGFLSRNAY